MFIRMHQIHLNIANIYVNSSPTSIPNGSAWGPMQDGTDTKISQLLCP